MKEHIIKLEDVIGICDKEIASACGNGRRKGLIIRTYITPTSPISIFVVKFEQSVNSEYEYHDIQQAIEKYNSIL